MVGHIGGGILIIDDMVVVGINNFKQLEDLAIRNVNFSVISYYITPAYII